MRAPFSVAFEQTIGHEGGLSLDRADRGNWTSGTVGVGELRGTKYGISAAAYPDLDIAGLSLAASRALYFRDYWLPMRGDDMPEDIAIEAFDAAVNHGVRAATLMLQRALRVDADGYIGPVTIAASHSVDPARFVARFNGERLAFYTDLPTWASFGKGWARRVAAQLRRA